MFACLTLTPVRRVGAAEQADKLAAPLADCCSNLALANKRSRKAQTHTHVNTRNWRGGFCVGDGNCLFERPKRSQDLAN